MLAAALHLAATDPDGMMLVAPSDHVIPDTDIFNATVAAAIPAALAGQLVTFGINPDRPETGYGYLELDAAPSGEATPVPLKSFVEKPDADTAATMLTEGRYLWNVGIFLFSVPTIVAAFNTHAPDMIKAVQASLDAAKSDLGFTRLDPAAWDAAQAMSIDYAVMEKASNLSVVPFCDPLLLRISLFLISIPKAFWCFYLGKRYALDEGYKSRFISRACMSRY